MEQHWWYDLEDKEQTRVKEGEGVEGPFSQALPASAKAHLEAPVLQDYTALTACTNSGCQRISQCWETVQCSLQVGQG